MAEFVLDPAAIQDLLESEQGPVARWLAGVAQAVTNRAKIESPVDTGRLRASLTWQLLTDQRGLVARVGTNVEYGPYVHDGAQGRPGNPFLERAAAAVLG